MSNWTYKGKEVETVDDIPVGQIGFIYLITHTPSNRRYIGRKLLTKAHRRQKNNKIIRSRIESDWKEYWSSSPEIIQMVAEEGTYNFTREILVFAPGKAILNYLEEKFLYTIGAMESMDWINGNIRSKVMKRHIIDKINTEEIGTLLFSLTNTKNGII